MSKKVEASGGIGFFSLLFLVFLVLKLVGVITWSWWWVTAPLWGPFLVCFAIYLLTVIIVTLVGRKKW